jgi:hypothetical protein
LIASLVASVGIIIGSIGPWANFMALSKNGVDGDGMITLVLGVISAVALFTLFSRGPKGGFIIRWIGPVVGVVCLVIAIVDIMNLSSNTTELFGETIGVQIGWGLWLMAISSAVLCLTSTTVAKQLRKS